MCTVFDNKYQYKIILSKKSFFEISTKIKFFFLDLLNVTLMANEKKYFLPIFSRFLYRIFTTFNSTNFVFFLPF